LGATNLAAASSQPSHAINTELEDTAMEEEEVKKYDPCFELDGAQIWKSQYLSNHFKELRNPGSRDRLKLYANVSHYAIKQNSHRDIVESDLSDGLDGPTIKMDFPVATLLKCEGCLFVCVGETNNITFNSNNIDSLSRTCSLNLQHLSPFRCFISSLPQLMTVLISSIIGSSPYQEVQATKCKVI